MRSNLMVFDPDGVTYTFLDADITLAEDQPINDVDNSPVLAVKKEKEYHFDMEMDFKPTPDFLELLFGGLPPKPEPRPAVDPTDDRLSKSWRLVSFRGTAACGRSIGRVARKGDIIAFVTDREKRFAEIALRGRGMSLRSGVDNNPLWCEVLDPWQRNEFTFFAEPIGQRYPAWDAFNDRYALVTQTRTALRQQSRFQDLLNGTIS